MPTPHHQRWVCLSPGEYQAAKPRLSHSNDSTVPSQIQIFTIDNIHDNIDNINKYYSWSKEPVTVLLMLTPEHFRCGCEECTVSRSEDSLRHSRSRINAYRALASPSLIALSSKDPILTAFELSWELKQLAFDEYEFKSEYLVSNRIQRSSV